MSNRMEQEFPPTTWPVMLPHDMDSMQHYLQRGRRLQARALNQAIGRLGRSAFAALRQWAAIVVAFVRDAMHGRAEPMSKNDHRAADAHCV